jgi:DNA (cytosine-5)-methyltransferase 1
MKDIQFMKPQIIDLFSGIGGITLGAERAGFHTALSVDLDKHAINGHKLNFPRSKHLSADLSKTDGGELMLAAGLNVGELDGLVGGPPCQGFSLIGKRDSTDPRNSLFIKFFKYVKECQPKFFLAENVLGILSPKYNKLLESAYSLVKDYQLIEPLILKASDYGAPTSRERVFFIGYKINDMSELITNDFISKACSKQTSVAEALFGLPELIDENWQTEDSSWRKIKIIPKSFYGNKITAEIPSGIGDEFSINKYKKNMLVSGCFGTRHTQVVVERFDKLKPGEYDKVSKCIRLKLDGLCPTIRAGTNTEHGSFQAVRPIHPIYPRVITPREAARLQGFPDWFRFAPTKWHSFRLLGNSVSPFLSEVVLNVLKEHLHE